MKFNKFGRLIATETDTHILGFFDKYRFLSNFHMSPCAVDGITYPSSEHAYMAQKTHDIDVKNQLANEIHLCSDARKFGQTIHLRKDWEEVKYESMVACLVAKFSQNKILQAELIATGDKILEETNHWNDTYWGVCNGVGENNLGKALMHVRSKLKE